MLADEDRNWLKKLHGELYPPDDTRTFLDKKMEGLFPHHSKKPVPPVPRAKLTHDELERVVGLIRGAKLLTVLRPHGPICGAQMMIYEHEFYPGTGPEPLVILMDEHLPDLNNRTWFEHLLEIPPTRKRKKGAGEIDPEAWDFFTTFTHSKQNREWLAHYGIDMKFDKTYYDY